MQKISSYRLLYELVDVPCSIPKLSAKAHRSRRTAASDGFVGLDTGCIDNLIDIRPEDCNLPLKTFGTQVAYTSTTDIILTTGSKAGGIANTHTRVASATGGSQFTVM